MDLTRWYKRSGKFVLASSFSLRKEMIFNEETYDKEHWRIRLDRLQREDFNRIKIPRFNYEMVDNRILFEIEFIKGRQLGATTFMDWRDVIKEDLVDREDDWGFGDLKPENFIIEKNTNNLYLVDFETYDPRDRQYKLSEWNKYLKISSDEIKSSDIVVNAKTNEFWGS